MYHLNIPQPDIVNPGTTGIYIDYLDGNKGHSTNIAKQEKRKTGIDIANYRNRPKKECKSSYNEYVNDMVSQDSGTKNFLLSSKLLNSQFSSVFSIDSTSKKTSQTLEPANIMKHHRLLSPKMVYTNCYMA